MKTFFSIFKFLLFSFVFFFSFFSSTETLIIHSSDQHSSYRRMQAFLGSIEVVTRNFKSKHPEGEILILINGDYSSLLHLTEADKGDFGYEILSQLARKYLILFTFGNHDSFDWNDSQVFLNQMKMLKRAGVQLLAANASFEPGYESLFSPFLDLSLSGQTVRFVGFTLPYEESFKFLEPEFGPKVVSGISFIDPIAARIMEQSDRDPEVSKVIFSMHLGHSKVKKIISKIASKYREKLSLVFAGHDHESFFGRIGSSYVVDSGAFFEFSTVILNDQAEFVNRVFYNMNQQKHLSQEVKAGSLEFQLIQKVKNFIASEKQFRTGFFDYGAENTPLDEGLHHLNTQGTLGAVKEGGEVAANSSNSSSQGQSRKSRRQLPNMRMPICLPQFR